MASAPHLNIVSPHQDDSALSLGSTLATMIEAGVRVTVVSCFTRSDWGLCLPSGTSVSEVSRIRAREDLTYLATLGEHARLVDLGLVDACLRADWPGPPDEAISAPLRARLQSGLSELVPNGGAWALPMELGHPDHQIALDAGLAVIGGAPVFFYEEVPYTLDVDEEVVLARAEDLERKIDRPLRPMTLHHPSRSEAWHAAVNCYPSQFSREQLEKMQAGLSSRGGERIWATAELVTWLEKARLLPTPGGQRAPGAAARPLPPGASHL